MAKKLSARQIKARKTASYVRREYQRNVEAIKYLERFGVTMPKINTPKKITKTSLKAIRKLYKQTRSKLQPYYHGEYVNLETGEIITKLPTKKEAARQYREEQQESYIPYTFNPDEQYIQDIKSKVNALTPLRDSDKSEKNYQKNVVPKQQEIKATFIQAIDDAIAQYGVERVAQTLAQNQYVQKIGNLEEKYTYQIMEEIEDGDSELINLMDASVDEALQEL